MRLVLLFTVLLAATVELASAQATVEGRVELPKSRSAPVMSKRYEIVTKGGVLATSPPLAVVYLEGSFPKRNAPGTKQVAQKDLTFVPALLRMWGKVLLDSVSQAGCDPCALSCSRSRT